VGSSNNVPSIGELILQAINLLEETHTRSLGCSIATGGFIATKLYDDVYGEGLSLEFILTQSKFYENE